MDFFLQTENESKLKKLFDFFEVTICDTSVNKGL